jgi:PASTA domain
VGLDDLLRMSWSTDPVEMVIERVVEWLFRPLPRRPGATVPAVIGCTVEQAGQLLAVSGLRMKIINRASRHDAAQRIVTGQKPVPGSRVRPGARVRVRTG